MNKKRPNKEYKLKVGENILNWRKLKGLKQEDLAERIGISTAALSNIENGVSKPSVERLEDIADALGIEVSWLLCNPQQMLAFNNNQQSNIGENHELNVHTNVDKAIMERLTTMMEKITTFFTSDKK